MRHLGSLLAALVITPLAWVLIAAGQPRAQQTFDRWEGANTVSTVDLVVPLGVLVGAGLLIGLIATIAWSPVGPLVAGLALLFGYVLALIRPFLVLDAMPVWMLNGTRVDLAYPFKNGTLAVLGSALVVAVVSRQRWRGTLAAPVATVPRPTDAGPTDARLSPPTRGVEGARPAETFGTTTAETAEDLPRPSRYRVGPAHYIPPPRRSQNEPDGPDLTDGDGQSPPPFSSPWAGPPRPPEG
jgi:hypothetical protein